jgi:hypothetical protein
LPPFSSAPTKVFLLKKLKEVEKIDFNGQLGFISFRLKTGYQRIKACDRFLQIFQNAINQKGQHILLQEAEGATAVVPR